MKKSKASKKKPAQANKKEAVQADRKKTAHQPIACSPEVKPLVLKLRQDWKNLDVDERVSRLQDIVSPGCSIRGLSRDLDVPEATLRRCLKFASTPEPKPAAVKTGVPDKKPMGIDIARDCAQEGMNEIVKEKPPRDLSDEVADIMLDFCKNAVHGEPIRGSELVTFLVEVKKLVRSGGGPTLASLQMSPKISWPQRYRMTRPPDIFGKDRLRYRAKWLVNILESTAPESIRETAFAKATQRAAELMPQPTPGEKKPTRIHPLQFVEHGFSLRNRR